MSYRRGPPRPYPRDQRSEGQSHGHHESKRRYPMDSGPKRSRYEAFISRPHLSQFEIESGPDPSEFRTLKSRWDQVSPGFEGVSARHLKLTGAVEPGTPLKDQNLSESVLKALHVKPLTPANSQLIKTLQVQGEDAQEYLGALFKSLGLETTITPTNDGILVESSKCSAVALALPGTLEISRPSGTVPDVCDDFYASPRLCCVSTDSISSLEELQARYPYLERIEWLKDQDGKDLGVALGLTSQKSSSEVHLFYSQDLVPASQLCDPQTRPAEFASIANSGPVHPSTRSLEVYNAVLSTQDPELVVQAIKEKCAEYGSPVVSAQVQAGKVRLEFESADACERALQLGGESLDGRPLVTALVM